MRFGDYELTEKIGVGGMAEVYKALALSAEGVERTLVIKKILPEHAANHHFVRMLVAEARVSSLLHHPNVVQIFDFGEIDAQYYIAMEYVHGPDLLAVLTSATHANLRLPLGLALYIISEICNGLHYAHKATDHEGRSLNLVHRDISPSNILISEEGAVKLMDFGVASADLARPGRSRVVENTSGTLKGKLGYMAPEQVTGQPVDHRADVFALGIVLFETLTLKRLFLGASDPETLKNIRGAQLDEKFERHPYIPQGVQAILRRALAKEPSQRYADAGAFREALLSYLFEQRLRVTHRTVARFLDDLNWQSAHRLRSGAHQSDPDQRAGDTSAKLTGDTLDLSALTMSEADFALINRGEHNALTFDYAAMRSLLHRDAIGPNEAISVSGHAPLTTEVLLAQHSFDLILREGEGLRQVRQGPCNRLVFAELLCDMARSETPLTLKVSRDDHAKTFSVSRGKIISADSTMREERLGHLMLSKGLISAEAMVLTIIDSAEQGSRLGDMLIAEGHVTPHRLLEILQLQLTTRMSELMSWRHGWYTLYEGVPSSGGPPLKGIDALELLVSTVRETWTLEELEALFEAHLEHRVIPRSSPAHKGTTLPFTPLESRLSSRIDTTKSITSLLETLTPEERLATLRIVMLRQRAGLISLGERGPDDARNT